MMTEEQYHVLTENFRALLKVYAELATYKNVETELATIRTMLYDIHYHLLQSKLAEKGE